MNLSTIGYSVNTSFMVVIRPQHLSITSIDFSLRASEWRRVAQWLVYLAPDRKVLSSIAGCSVSPGPVYTLFHALPVHIAVKIGCVRFACTEKYTCPWNAHLPGSEFLNRAFCWLNQLEYSSSLIECYYTLAHMHT